MRLSRNTSLFCGVCEFFFLLLVKLEKLLHCFIFAIGACYPTLVSGVAAGYLFTEAFRATALAQLKQREALQASKKIPE